MKKLLILEQQVRQLMESAQNSYGLDITYKKGEISAYATTLDLIAMLKLRGDIK